MNRVRYVGMDVHRDTIWVALWYLTTDLEHVFGTARNQVRLPALYISTAIALRVRRQGGGGIRRESSRGVVLAARLARFPRSWIRGFK
jgi:hypothetical protein